MDKDARETKRGRPIDTNSRKHQYRLRMSEAECDILNELSGKTGKNKSDVIREALRVYSNLINCRN